MSVWLILSPAIAWLTAGLAGLYLLRTPADSAWRNMQLSTVRIPFDRDQHRWFAIMIRMFGLFFLLMPVFLTLMSILVVVGVVPPAQN